MLSCVKHMLHGVHLMLLNTTKEEIEKNFRSLKLGKPYRLSDALKRWFIMKIIELGLGH
jgi:hypothetical protein